MGTKRIGQCFLLFVEMKLAFLSKSQVEELRSRGLEPYAYGWEKTHTAHQLHDLYRHLANGEESSGEEDLVSVAGRVVARRVFGKLAFLTLRDNSGTIQVCLFYHD